jgi:AAA15 family ATPase/GTPase
MLERPASEGGTKDKNDRFLFESFEISNYRAFRRARFSDLRRVNVIGGMNGVGKTTLLEAMFSMTDYVNPIGMMKAFGWKQLTFDSQDISSYLFHDGAYSEPIVFNTETREGALQLQFTYAQNPRNLQPNLDPTANANPLQGTASTTDIASRITNSSEYVQLDVSLDGKPLESTLSVVIGTQLQSTKTMISQQIFPLCAYLAKGMMGNPHEIAKQFTAVLQTRKKSRMLQLIQVLSPKVEDLIILQSGSEPRLCANIGNETYVPISFLGDGASTLLNIGLAITTIKDGALFLDEFDSAIHYSRLAVVWAELFKLASEYNAQIFAVTHSKECIVAAAAGAKESGYSDDFLYMRLNNFGQGVQPTRYDTNELLGAFEEDWEVR